MIIKIVISYTLGFVCGLFFNTIFFVKKNENEYEILYSSKFPKSNYIIYIENLKKQIRSMTYDEIEQQLKQEQQKSIKNLSYEEMDKSIRYEIMLLNEKNKRENSLK